MDNQLEPANSTMWQFLHDYGVCILTLSAKVLPDGWFPRLLFKAFRFFYTLGAWIGLQPVSLVKKS